MVAITGFTKERVDALDNSTITDAGIVGNNLMLYRRDGTVINAGNAKGATGPTGPAGSGALGRIGYVEKVTQQGGIGSTQVAITAMELTFTAVAGRRYRISAQSLLFSTSNGDIASLRITNSIGTVQQWAQEKMVASFGTSVRCDLIIAPGSGSLTYKLYVARDAGSGTITFDCGGQYPAFLSIEDLGT